LSRKIYGSMKNFSIEIRWGIMFSILTIVWMILEKTLGWHDAQIGRQLIYTNLFGFVAVTIYILALLEKKKQFFKGDITWKQGFLSGTVLSVVIAILSPMVNAVIYTYITPRFFDAMISYRVAHKFQTLTQAQAYFNLHSYIVLGIFDALSKGILTSAIVAFFIKTKNSSDEK
jgi:hypothetical protein